MTKVLLCYVQYMLVTNNTGSLFVSRSLSGILNYCVNYIVFGLHLDSFGRHWISVGRYVKEIIVQNRRQWLSYKLKN